MRPHYDDIYPPSKGPYEPAKIPAPGAQDSTNDAFATTINSLQNDMTLLKAKMLDWNEVHGEKVEILIKKLMDNIDKVQEFTLRDSLDIVELQAKLKETIRGVERLAGGKSLGNLGLPTEESWQKSTS